MNRINKDIFTARFPHLDIHGEYSAIADTLIKEFINDNYKIGNKTVIIIHGKGYGILKKKTHEILAQDSRIESFNYNIPNMGETIVILKEK